MVGTGRCNMSNSNPTTFGKKGEDARADELRSKGAKSSAETKNMKKNLRDVFAKEMTLERKKEAFNILWEMFTKHKNLYAWDRIWEILKTAENADLAQIAATKSTDINIKIIPAPGMDPEITEEVKNYGY